MLDMIYITRHGFRMNWQGNEVFAPTGRPRDPVLTAHGLAQARDLANHLASLPEDERPQLVLSSPYYRCCQTAEPSAHALGLPLLLEPGLSEWFPPVLPLDSGFHPSPARASTMRDYFPCIVPDAWDPLLYPNSSGEDIAALHARARDLLQALDARLAQKARKDGKEIRRVLLVTHAATAIALGRSLLCDASAHIGAATASLSLYTRAPGAGAAANDNANTNTAWTQKLNGSAVHLPKGPERDWAFDHVPDNVTEPGMGQGWVDEEAPVSPLPTNVDEKTAAVVNKSSL